MGFHRKTSSRRLEMQDHVTWSRHPPPILGQLTRVVGVRPSRTPNAASSRAESTCVRGRTATDVV